MICIISSTNRKGALSYQLSLLYKNLLEQLGEEAQIIDLANLPEDFAFSALYENSGKHSQFNEIIDQVNQADKFIFVIPEYNGSFPGVLKTFIDGMSYPNPLKNKVCGLVGLSSGMQGSALALSHMTDILNYLGAIVVPVRPKCPDIESKYVDGKITDNTFNQLLEEQAKQLISL